MNGTGAVGIGTGGIPAAGGGIALPPRRRFVRPLVSTRHIWPLGAAAVGTATIVTAFGLAGWAYGAQSAVMALAGAMAVLFARGEPYLHRAGAVIGVSLLILALSAAASVAAPYSWALLAVLTAGAATAGVVTEALRTSVPGPTLVLVPATIVAAIPGRTGVDLGHRAGMIGLGCALALVMTLSPWLVSRYGPEARALAAAYQAIAQALRAVGIPAFHRQRSTAWSALTTAERALTLAARVPGRNQKRASTLRTLARYGDALLVQAERMHAAANPPSETAAAAAQQVAEHLRARPRLLRVAGPLRPDTDAAQARAQTALAFSGGSASPLVSHRAIGRRRPRRQSRVVLSWRGLTYPTRLALAALAAGSIAIGIGLDRWYWVPVCAVATIWGSDTWITWHRAVQRAVATAVGCLAAAGLVQVHIGFATGVVLVGALFFAGELLFPRNYGFALAPVSAMILIIIHLASPVGIDGWTLAAQRISAAGLGSGLGLLAVLVAWPLNATTQLAGMLATAKRLQGRIRGQLATGRLRGEDLMPLRGQLLDNLIRVDRTAGLALGEFRARAVARDRYLQAAAVAGSGYQLLGQLDDYITGEHHG